MFEIANRIYPPSYVSLEMALAYYQLIPESVYGVTSVSSRRVEEKKFYSFLDRFGKASLERRARAFREFMDRDGS